MRRLAFSPGFNHLLHLALYAKVDYAAILGAGRTKVVLAVFREHGQPLSTF